MRFTPILLSATILAVGACKDDAQEIGTFNVQLDGKDMEFVSTLDAENDTSSIRVMTPSGIKLIMIDGSAGDTKTGIPIISMTLQSGVTNSNLSLMFVQVFDKTFDTVLTSDGPNGNRQLKDMMLDDEGNISFSFSADLVRVETQSEAPIAGADGAHIEGRFSGKIPASEMEE